MKRPNPNKIIIPRTNSVPVNDRTPQGRKALCQDAAWDRWKVVKDRDGAIVNAPTDGRVILPRKVRREMARRIAKDAKKVMDRKNIAEQIRNIGK